MLKNSGGNTIDTTYVLLIIFLQKFCMVKKVYKLCTSDNFRENAGPGQKGALFLVFLCDFLQFSLSQAPNPATTIIFSIICTPVDTKAEIHGKSVLALPEIS